MGNPIAGKSARRGGFVFLASLLLAVLTAGPVRAQHLQQQVAVREITRQPIAAVLETLGAGGNFHFSYSSDRVPADSIISMPAFNGSLHDFLLRLLGPRYDFKELSGYVIIRYSPNRLQLAIEIGEATDQLLVVAGRVTDAQTQTGVANVSIYDQHSFASALSDGQGYFKLEIRKPEPTVWMGVSKENYRDTTLVILMPVEVRHRNRQLTFRYYPGYDNGMPLWRTRFGRFFTNSKQRVQQLNIGAFLAEQSYQLSLLPGISTHGLSSSRTVSRVSFNLIGGHAGGVSGVELSGVFALNELDVAYAQAAGLFNLVGGNVRGIQAAGIANRVVGSFEGLQVAGLYNATGKHITGMQLAGIMNRAGKVNGVQLAALVNLADSSDYPIGLVNLIKNGHRNLSIEGDEQGYLRLSFRSGGRVLYGIIGLGYGLAGQQLPYQVQTGIGARLITGALVGLNAELTGRANTDFHRQQFRYDMALLPQVRLTPWLDLYGGPSLGAVSSNRPLLTDEQPWTIRRFRDGKGAWVAGFTTGIRYSW